MPLTYVQKYIVDLYELIKGKLIVIAFNSIMIYYNKYLLRSKKSLQKYYIKQTILIENFILKSFLGNSTFPLPDLKSH